MIESRTIILMKQFIDYIPLFVFFSVWAMDERTITFVDYQHSVGGIFSAAEFLLASSILVYGGLFMAQRRLDKFQWITLAAVVLFTIPTIIFRDTNFLKWKAPIVNWIFASIFTLSRYFGEKPAVEHMMGHTITAPKEVWIKLNSLWVGYFVALGAINLAVAFGLSEALWIQFKVFGNFVLTFVFILGTMPLLAKYINTDEIEKDDAQEEKAAESTSTP